ncbi:hypothetical protein U3516DRAFT_856813 [Neocallimastix sp. 'constans']
MLFLKLWRKLNKVSIQVNNNMELNINFKYCKLNIFIYVRCGKVTYCSFNNTYIDCYNNVANICENYILGFNIYRVCSENDVMEVFNQITCDRMVSQDCEKLNKFLNRTLCDDVYPKFDNENNNG